MYLKISILILYAITTCVSAYALTSNYATRLANDYYTWTFMLLILTTALIAQLHPTDFMYRKQSWTNNYLKQWEQDQKLLIQGESIHVSELDTKPVTFDERMEFYRTRAYIGFACILGLLAVNPNTQRVLKQVCIKLREGWKDA